MSKWKIGFWVSTSLLIMSIVIAAYVLIDQSVSIMYLKAGYEGTENDLQTLNELINETDLSKSRN